MVSSDDNKWKLAKQVFSQTSPHGLMRRFKTSSQSFSKKTCALCLKSMNPGEDRPIFTAECLHSFHYDCITSNLKHGNRVCSLCNTDWEEIPFQSRSPGPPDMLRRQSLVTWNTNNLQNASLRQQPLPQPRGTCLLAPEPVIYNDDDVRIQEGLVREQGLNMIEIRAFPELSAIAQSAFYDDFAVHIHIKAPVVETQNPSGPVDVVIVVDVSASMAGTKLALLQEAMRVVINNLSQPDRLSVIAFSSTAHRLLPLRRMNDPGRYQAHKAVDSLSLGGGTNIALGLEKGLKVFSDRKYRNPNSSIILFSDGNDTCALTGITVINGLRIPVHTFGFGDDQDAFAMSTFSEASGGTFSFIEDREMIQDAFSQCIGGQLSVVAHKLGIFVECMHPDLKLTTIEAGRYLVEYTNDLQNGSLNTGDLYSDEEKDFLVIMDIPEASTIEPGMSLVKVKCNHMDLTTNEVLDLDEVDVKIDRPDTAEVGQLVVSSEVDKERSRVRAVNAMSIAISLAEFGDWEGAVSALQRCVETVSGSRSMQSGDPLIFGLVNELRDMQARASNRLVNEGPQRAFVVSGVTSHSWRRPIAANVSEVLEKTMMGDMITRSQTMVVGYLPPETPVLSPLASFQVPLPR